MSHEIDEVLLTAYTLGELSGAEAAEVEAFLSTNPAARREVEAIRAMGESLTAELATEPATPLTPAQRQAIAEAAKAPAPTLHDRSPGVRQGSWRFRPWAVAAASVLVVFFTIVQPWNVTSHDQAEKSSGNARAEAPRAHFERENEDLRLQLKPSRPAMIEEYTYSDVTAAPPPPGETAPAADLVTRSSPSARGIITGRAPGGSKPATPRQLMGLKTKRAPRGYDEDPNSTESYAAFKENGFVRALGDDARSTFALDVDTASYSNVRRFLRQGRLPDKGAVRIEELINYFDYDYPDPKDGKPLAVSVEVGTCPWAPSHQLALVGFKAKAIEKGERPKANLVFLIDVSGSMNDANKLPLVKKALRMLITRLGVDDKVALVVYAGTSGLVLPSTRARERGALEEAIERLEAGGSTNGGQGIELAYSVAKESFIPGGINRVILCTDGDFNVGTTSESALVELIEKKAKTGVFLTALGFGMGNLKDSTIQKLANKGNGNYGYVDGENEAKKLLVDQVDGTLVTVAKDARIQVEFNPARVGAWRLVGYERRVMANRDFHDDTKDAGEVGAGHTVTALYEIIPAGNADLEKLPKADPLRYQGSVSAGAGQASADLMTVAYRWKPADGDVSTLAETKVQDAAEKTPSRNFRWACSVAMFGMELRGSEFKGLTNWALVDELAREAKGADARGLRAEFVELIGLARNLSSPSK